MEARPRNPRISLLGGSQFLVVLVMLLMVVLVATAVLWPQLAQEYILTVRAPSLESTFGFRGEYIGRAYVLTDVRDGGRLYQAGFRPGDRPSAGICRFYGDYVSAEAFFDDLDHVQAGHTVDFWVGRGQGQNLEFLKLSLTASSRQGPR